MPILQDFKDFALRGNVVDMAVGIIIGASFGAVVKSAVANMLMPPLGLALGNVDFTNLFVVMRAGHPIGPYATIAEAHKEGAVTLNYGVFLNSVISFAIIAVCVFLLIRVMNRLQGAMAHNQPIPAATQQCPHCDSTISVRAHRCAFCTTEL